MPYIEWNKEMDVGVSVFNDEHKALVKYINELHSGLVAGFSIVDMGYILDGLVRYTQVHFKHEEENMEKYDYPKFTEHKKEHDRLIAEVVHFKEQFENGKRSFSLELLVFLKDWLVEHIMGEDKKYKEFFSGRDVL